MKTCEHFQVPISKIGTRSMRGREGVSQSHEGFAMEVLFLLCWVLSCLVDETNPFFNARSWFAQVLPRKMISFNTVSGHIHQPV